MKSMFAIWLVATVAASVVFLFLTVILPNAVHAARVLKQRGVSAPWRGVLRMGRRIPLSELAGRSGWLEWQYRWGPSGTVAVTVEGMASEAGRQVLSLRPDEALSELAPRGNPESIKVWLPESAAASDFIRSQWYRVRTDLPWDDSSGSASGRILVL